MIERASIEGRMFHRGSVAELVPEQTRPRVGSHLIALVRKELVGMRRSRACGSISFRWRSLARPVCSDRPVHRATGESSRSGRSLSSVRR